MKSIGFSKKNGILIMSAPLDIHIHEEPYDYWRYLPDGFRSLLKPFNSSYINSYVPPRFPRTIIGVGFKGSISEIELKKFKEKIKVWKAY